MGGPARRPRSPPPPVPQRVSGEPQAGCRERRAAGKPCGLEKSFCADGPVIASKIHMRKQNMPAAGEGRPPGSAAIVP